MNILITGANGYIGKNLANSLAGHGHAVTALMRHACVIDPKVKQLIMPDYDAPEWDSTQTFKDIDVVIHTAGRVHQKNIEGKKFIEEYKQNNVNLSLQLAQKAAVAGVRQFVFISTVGAQLLENQFHQGIGTWQKAWNDDPYRASKLETERQLDTLFKHSDMKIICVRLPMVYGMDAPGNFLTLLRWLKKGLPVPFVSLMHPRPYISIDTAVDFIFFCLTNPDSGLKKWSVRDMDELTPSVFALELANAAGLPPPRLVFCPNELMQMLAWLFGVSKTAKNLAEQIHIDLAPVEQKLGWIPKMTVKEGLQKAFSKVN